MKAAMARKKDGGGSTLHLEEIEIPVPQKDEALIKVHYAGICGTDMHIITGHYKQAPFPLVIGHEFVGEVAGINSDIETDFKKGEKVAIHPIRTCGTCDACRRGMENVCETLSVIGCHENGGFAEYVTVPVGKLLKMPQDINMEQAGLLEPLSVAVHDVRMSGLTVGEEAVVIGGGPIGILIALVARLAGAHVMVSEVNDFRIDFIRGLGIEVLDPKKADVEAEVMKMTGGRGVDVTYEVSGTAAGAALMTKITKRGGMIVNIGTPSEPTPVNIQELFFKEIRQQGVRLHRKSDFEIAIKLIASGVIENELKQFVTKVFSLDEVEAAMRYAIEDQRHFKVLIKM